MLVTSIFSFSYNVFCRFQNKFQFGQIYFVVCKYFEFLAKSKLKAFAGDKIWMWLKNWNLFQDR